MANPLLYDIKRTLTSKSVLILMLVMIGFGFAVIPSFTSVGGGGPGNNFPNNQIFTYYDSGGGYHFLAFAWNQFGQGVSGITFQANLTLNPPTFYGGGPISVVTTGESQSPVFRTQAISTDSNGEARFSVTAPLNSSYYVSVLITQPNGLQVFGGISQPYQTFLPYNGTSTIYAPKTTSIPPGEVVGFYGGGGISLVVDASNSSQMDVQAIWVGPNGTLPGNYSVYYLFQNLTNTACSGPGPQLCTTAQEAVFNPNTLNDSNMHLLGTMTSYRQIFSPPKLEANLTADSGVYLALFYPNGTMAGGPNFMGTQQLYPPPPPPITPGQGTEFVLSFFQVLFGIFIPLLAIVGSFNSYGKDRVSGVLESVLAQPVSRRGLSISRFLSSFSATAIAVAIAIGVVDSIAFYFSKAFVDSTIILSSTGAFFVELAALIAIMMLLAHVVKSSGALIGIGIGLFLVIDFFWGIIIGLVATLSNTLYGSTAYYQLLIFAQFVNPAQFVSLVDTYLTHLAGFVGLSFFSLPVTPEAYGITIPAIIATGVLWIAIPFAIFMYLATKRD